MLGLDRIIEIILDGKDEKKCESFLKFLSNKLWDSYKQYVMDKIVVIGNEVNSWNINIPNAKENKEYYCPVELPSLKSTILSGVAIRIESVEGLSLEQHGLFVLVNEDRKGFVIQGKPNLDSFRKDGTCTAESSYEIVIKYTFEGPDVPDDRPVLEKKLPIIINQDPRKLWKNLPVDWDNMPEPKYVNEDTQTVYIKVEAKEDGAPQKDIVAASKRGRSHAQEAKPRDDHFKMRHLENGWYIMSVADGAGSAKYSREGSRIACETVINHCAAQLNDCEDFEEHINTYNEYRNESESDARKMVGDYIYKIVGTAAFKAQKAIFAEATAQNIPSKLYATTLLLTICKKFSYGWFVASFWVGDGAICLYNREKHSTKLLGVPDEGEYAGQTRFLTMPEIFKDATSLYQRLRFYIVPDFTALFLMTDGVSDPKFETDANLNNPDKWDALWEDLIHNEEHPVDLSDDHEEAEKELLDWLDFWVPGNHDDRTIAILY